VEPTPTAPEDQAKKKTRRGSSGTEHHAPSEAPNRSAGPKPPSQSASGTKPSSPAVPAKLTPLHASMREKLVSARFRSLNETLYTRPSAEAYKLFLEQPEMFREYHEGFRRQVEAWPENPVDSIIGDI